MTTDAEFEAIWMVKVGSAIPGGPVGDIWVAKMLIAQKGEAYVRQMVRETYAAAYAAKAKRRSAPTPSQESGRMNGP